MTDETTPDPPDGCIWVWVPAREIPSDLGWQVVKPEDSRPCRYAAKGHEQCKRPSVVRLDRSRTDTPKWWHYCELHMYGRRIIDGEVFTRIAEEIPDA